LILLKYIDINGALSLSSTRSLAHPSSLPADPISFSVIPSRFLLFLSSPGCGAVPLNC